MFAKMYKGIRHLSPHKVTSSFKSYQCSILIRKEPPPKDLPAVLTSCNHSQTSQENLEQFWAASTTHVNCYYRIMMLGTDLSSLTGLCQSYGGRSLHLLLAWVVQFGIILFWASIERKKIQYKATCLVYVRLCFQDQREMLSAVSKICTETINSSGSG